jgi:hypothetical protein
MVDKLCYIDGPDECGIFTTKINSCYFNQVKKKKLISIIVGVVAKTLIKSQETNNNNFFNIVFDMSNTTNHNSSSYIDLAHILKKLYINHLNRCDIVNAPSYVNIGIDLLKSMRILDRKTINKINLIQNIRTPSSVLIKGPLLI